MNRGIRLSLLALGVAWMLAGIVRPAAAEAIDNAALLQKSRVTGVVALDPAQTREGHAALRLAPGSKAAYTLRNDDGTGQLSLWVYEDAAAPNNPKAHASGPLWGLMQKDGRMVAVGPIYAPYLSGATTYAAATGNPDQTKPWQEVQYLGGQRTPGWHQWTFDFDPAVGLTLRCDGQLLKEFNWNKSRLNGFDRLVLFGDASDAKRPLWVDAVDYTPGPAARVQTQWPPAPPACPADLTVLPPQAPWNPTPYAAWPNGPGANADFFPLAVWLQDPRDAARYRAAGINLFLGLWKGPTEAQLAALKQAGMRVICAQNAVGLAHRGDPTIAGWLQPDEPDNAQVFKDFWKSDVNALKAAWPEIEAFRTLGPGKPYQGYGPPIPPTWIVRDYKQCVAQDPTRPVFLGLGMGVAYEKYIGRGERTGQLEDYPKYMAGCDIVGYDIYPAASADLAIRNALWYVPRGVRRLREWCQDRKPVWVHIETGCIGSGDCRPTPAQVRAEIWMALIHGARGVDYFVHQFSPSFNAHALLDNPAMLEAVTRENQQITQLARVLNSPTLPDAATVVTDNPHTPVHTMVKQHDGTLYLFAAAMDAQPTRATFRLPALAGTAGPAAHAGRGKAEVLGENRALPVQNGTFTDTFDGYGVHLYCLRQ